MGTTTEYVDFCLGIKYEDLPPEVIEYAKRLCLDFVGVALTGRRVEYRRCELDLPHHFLPRRREVRLLGAVAPGINSAERE